MKARAERIGSATDDREAKLVTGTEIGDLLIEGDYDDEPIPDSGIDCVDDHAIVRQGLGATIINRRI